MSYTITIVKTEIKPKVFGKEWKIVSKIGDNSEYGYTPEITKEEEVFETIYEQTVDEIDLHKLIGVVIEPLKKTEITGRHDG